MIMKKWLGILLVAALCLSWVVGALAQSDFLATMSREELLALQKEVEKKLNPLIFEEKWLSGEPVTLEPGIYAIGKEIPRGSWKVEGIESEASAFALGTELSSNKRVDERYLVSTNFMLYTSYPDDYEHIIDCQNGMYLNLLNNTILTRVK